MQKNILNQLEKMIQRAALYMTHAYVKPHKKILSLIK